MTIGVAHWMEASRFYSQENNPTEAYNKARLANDAKYWLETCGPTAAVNCLAAMGVKVSITCPGVYEPQPEEVLMDYLNDPRNANKLRAIRDLGEVDIPENQVPQYYPIAVAEVFGVRSDFAWSASWSLVTEALDRGRAVQLCLKKPSHYIAVVAYNNQEQALCFNDSWGSRFPDGKGGHNRWMSASEIRTNVQPYRIEHTTISVVH